MRLTVVGSSGSFPGPGNPASCYLVEADGFRVLLDLGSGALGELARQVSPDDVDAVLLSHLHPDHCLDLCGLYVARKYRPEGPRLPRLPVHGPAGTAERMARAYGPSEKGLSEKGLTEELDFVDWQPTQRIGPFLVTVARVEHPVEAYGIRLEHDGAVLTYSGDTDSCDALVDLARDADVFLCEASFLEGRDEGRGVHLTGLRAGRAAADAGARRLLLTHLPPWTPGDAVLAEAARTYAGPTALARPGDVVEVGGALDRVAP
ncbi:MAG TPA: MBL fold metallo-hydrolase [Motilibacteraceae bacterium]|nr:MBL fold metallo-hydrolase [Motilibacteraceae bacterium]